MPSRTTDVRRIAVVAWAVALWLGCGSTASPSTPQADPEAPREPQPADEGCDDACADHEVCVADRCVCAPQCDDNPCGDDGCGGRCACPDGYQQNGNGQYVPADQCDDTCASARFQCGEVCGEACGTCAADAQCRDGRCECKPQCDGTRCDDGCGGTCACGKGTECDAAGACVAAAACDDTCADTGRACGSVCGEACGTCAGDASCSEGRCVPALNCDDCALRFHMIERATEGDAQRFTFALDYDPSEVEPRPRLADIRIRASRAVRVVDIVAGDALRTAGKELHVDGRTDEPFQVRDDGTIQILIYRATSTTRMLPGRLFTATFEARGASPVELSLVRRDQIFAPAEADAALQGTAYDRAVTVSP